MEPVSPYKLMGSHTTLTGTLKAQRKQSKSQGFQGLQGERETQDYKGYKVFVVNKDLSQVTRILEVV